jgi:hypothetical protein
MFSKMPSELDFIHFGSGEILAMQVLENKQTDLSISP